MLCFGSSRKWINAPPPPQALHFSHSMAFSCLPFSHLLVPGNPSLCHFSALVALARQTCGQCVQWNKPDPKKSRKKRNVCSKDPVLVMVFWIIYTPGITSASMSALFLKFWLHVVSSARPKLHLLEYLLSKNQEHTECLQIELNSVLHTYYQLLPTVYDNQAPLSCFTFRSFNN